MAFLKLDDQFDEHPKVVKLSDKAFRLHISGLCYCSRHLTDGFLSNDALTVLGANSNVSRPQLVAKQLLSAKLWRRTKGGYRIHDYTQHQRSKADVERDRAAARERVRRFRSKHVTPAVTPLRNGVSSGAVTRLEVEEDIKALDLSSKPKGNSGPATSQNTAKIAAFVRTIAVNYPDERILREDLEDRFKTASPQDVEQGIQLWRQLTNQAAGTAEQAPEGLAS